MENNPQIETSATTTILEMNDTNQHNYSPHTQILKRPFHSKRNDYEKQFNSNRITGNNNINTQKIPSSKIDNDTPNIISMTTSTTTAKTSTNKTADIIGSLPAQEVSISSMTTIKQIKQRSSDNNNDTSNNINNSTNKLSKVASEKSMTETDTNTGSYNVGQPIIDVLKHHDKNKNTKTSPSTTTTNKKQVDKDKNKKSKRKGKKGSKSNSNNNNNIKTTTLMI